MTRMTPGLVVTVAVTVAMGGLVGFGAPSVALAGPRVLGFSLPGRSGDALARRVERVTDDLARGVGGTVVAGDDPNRKPLELAAPLERAQSLASHAMFDEAATAFDELLAVALHAPQRVDAPAQLVASMIARASIAIARHEPKRATDLLDRLLRYDPAVTLSPSEDEPGVHAQLQQLRRKLGTTPTLGAEELGSACRAADVVVVARTIEGGRVEMSRFDDCRLVTKTEFTAGADDQSVAAALTQPSDVAKIEPSPASVRPEILPDYALVAPRPTPKRRAERIAGWAALGVGLGALAAGGAFAGLAKVQNDDIEHPSAGAVWPQSLQDRLHLYESLDVAFFAVGGAAVVAGAVVEILGHRL